MHEEIDSVIKEMSADRAPGPDGFSALFLKACWPIIKDDFYTLCSQFHAGDLNLQSINDGLITLIPKVGSPSTVNDYHPITLLNCCLKLITKLLANRLQKVILRIIHRNQYGFIHGRTIQDCLAWTFQYIHQCQTSRRKTVLLKLDFAKAFDTIEHDSMIKIMKHMGFNDKWLSWIQAIFSSVGLKINFHKSTLIPINLDSDMATTIASIFGCLMGSMPFTYLGLPLGTSRPTLQDFMPLVSSIERNLSSTLSLMSYAGKLTLVNTTVTSLLIYAMCMLKFPPKLIEMLDKIRRRCWDAYYDQKIPHATDPIGSFWWKDVLKLTPEFRGISRVNIVCGTMALFWKDLWTDQLLSESHPRAYSYAVNEDVSVRDFLGITSLGMAFHLPLSPRAHDEVRNLQLIATTTQPMTATSDVWHYVWGKTTFKSMDYYKFFFREILSHQVFRWLWRSKCTMKLKVFAWFLLNDRLNTHNMLKRCHYNIGDDHNCLLCGLNIEETVEYMIFTCNFSKHYWHALDINWEPFFGRLQAIEDQKASHPTPMLLEKFVVAAWSIWKERNNKHFRAIDPSFSSWLGRFKKDFQLLQHRVKEDHKSFVLNFVNSLP
ncbi:uncharacterized protein [Aegilops tauschii subsp. strangulata]|uniref:uncharacterized protein n=1 Tax=Aegilops tauschii subsp. strangulata TaxID=200361 RepID=UPI003CC83D01